ncbi:hypothetical protein BO82DRAFT_401358 [Aspergillus uvarum CBS 121591]|uniref:Uncharacterized protein n=1 Tax=Aspergillus uvarum CBS 121591 TaxID=1448315 RepID=A0A319CHI4_9EURO|nr:hypothetical protein BO82DRAFT_401358 [Aspergillus uvarum CBS 121591]PYH82717.1 hypothetical protein BO82DRAFT_401358 [Aspergillus uvarum CBS 121591]
MAQARPASEITAQPLPQVSLGPGTTRSNALHALLFQADIKPWSVFTMNVHDTFRNHNWLQVAEPLSLIELPPQQDLMNDDHDPRFRTH